MGPSPPPSGRRVAILAGGAEPDFLLRAAIKLKREGLPMLSSTVHAQAVVNSPVVNVGAIIPASRISRGSLHLSASACLDSRNDDVC